MLAKVFLVFGLVALIAQSGQCEDEKRGVKYERTKPAKFIVPPNPSSESRPDDAPSRPAYAESRFDNAPNRPGFVASASVQDSSEENLPFRYSVQEKARPERQIGQPRPVNRPRPQPSVARRPTPSQLRPQQPNQGGAPSGFGPSAPQQRNPAPQLGSPARPAQSSFKPFDDPESSEKEEATQQRPARNPSPSQYRPKPADDYSGGFPAGFADGLPNFRFQGTLPDSPAAESRGFLEGFGNFPNFKTIGGFEPLGAAGNHHAVSGQPPRPSNLKKRNPGEEEEVVRPTKFSSPENREERYYADNSSTRTRRDSAAQSIYYNSSNPTSSSVPKSHRRRNTTKVDETKKQKYSKLKIISSKIDVDPEIFNKQKSHSSSKIHADTANLKQKPHPVTKLRTPENVPVNYENKDLKKSKSRSKSKPSLVESDEAFMDEEVNDEFLLSDAFFKPLNKTSKDDVSDSQVAEQRFLRRRNNRQGNNFPSFESFRPFFEDFHGFRDERPVERPKERPLERPKERPVEPPRRSQRPRPRPTNDQRFDGSDNSLLGSGNFLVLPGGTFKDSTDYSEYYVNNRYKPYRPDYNEDFFSNFRDFAEINKRDY